MVIPTILESSVDTIQEKVHRIKGLATRVQIDVIDGVFADSLTVSPIDLVRVDFGELAVDLHLMTEEPVDFIDECRELRSRVESLRVVGQIERMSNQADFIQEARKAGCDAGLALALYTPISSVDPRVLDQLDCLLLLAVKTGFSGQHFSHEITEKIVSLRRKWPKGEIIIDGGEDPIHISMSKKAGATSFAVNSFLWQHEDIKVAMKQLEES